MAITIFSVSLGICVLMLISRMVEMKRQKAFFYTRSLDKVDVVLEKKFNTFKESVLHKKKEAVFFATHYVPFYIWNQIRNLTGGLQRKYDKIERTVRGRHMVKQAGEVSPFIKNITERPGAVTETAQMQAEDEYVEDSTETAIEMVDETPNQ